MRIPTENVLPAIKAKAIAILLNCNSAILYEKDK